MFGRELFQDISNEQGGDLGRVFKSLASGGRQTEEEVDYDLAELEADELFEVELKILIKLLLNVFYVVFFKGW